MAHVFDIMATVCRQLNSFSSSFPSGSPNIPEFLMVMVTRELTSNPGIAIDQSKPIVIEEVSKSYAGNPTAVVYTAVANNINTPIIDTFCITTDAKDRKNKDIIVCDTAIGIIIPKILYDDETDIRTASDILRKIYFGILNTDSKMSYSASPAIIRLANSDQIKIPTYDIEVTICAICCIYVNLSDWFGSDDGADGLGAEYATNAFTDEEIPASMKKKIHTIIYRHVASTKSLRDAIGSGKLLKIFFS